MSWWPYSTHLLGECGIFSQQILFLDRSNFHLSKIINNKIVNFQLESISNLLSIILIVLLINCCDWVKFSVCFFLFGYPISHIFSPTAHLLHSLLLSWLCLHWLLPSPKIYQTWRVTAGMLYYKLPNKLSTVFPVVNLHWSFQWILLLYLLWI